MYRDSYGLLTVNTEGQSEENSFLWTVELFVIQKKLGLPSWHTESILNDAVAKMDLGNGLYRQAPHLDPNPENKDTYMSHDQLTALIVFFKLTGQKDKIKEIRRRFKFGLSYNNVDSKFRFFHPRDIIFYNIMAGGIFSYLLLPLLWLITMETFITEYKVRNGNKIIKTDGEILYYIKREATKVFKPVDAFCEMRIRQRFGSWDKVFSTYFKPEDHPINLIEGK